VLAVALEVRAHGDAVRADVLVDQDHGSTLRDFSATVCARRRRSSRRRRGAKDAQVLVVPPADIKTRTCQIVFR
jgi:hypothetical protein